MYDSFWISDLPENEADRDTHALMYDAETDKTYLVNKLFIESVVVVVIKQYCDWKKDDDLFGGNLWTVACGNDFQFIEGDVKDNEFKYCPYCGREIKEIA